MAPCMARRPGSVVAHRCATPIAAAAGRRRRLPPLARAPAPRRRARRAAAWGDTRGFPGHGPCGSVCRGAADAGSGEAAATVASEEHAARPESTRSQQAAAQPPPRTLPKGYTLRGARRTDVSALCSLVMLESAEARNGWGREALEAEFDNPVCRIVVAESAMGIIDGFVVAWLVAGEVQILNLAVRPSKQRMGIGSELVRQMVSLREDGLPAILEVAEDNVAAVALYERCGFVRAGDIKVRVPVRARACAHSRCSLRPLTGAVPAPHNPH